MFRHGALVGPEHPECVAAISVTVNGETKVEPVALDWYKTWNEVAWGRLRLGDASRVGVPMEDGRLYLFELFEGRLVGAELRYGPAWTGKQSAQWKDAMLEGMEQ